MLPIERHMPRHPISTSVALVMVALSAAGCMPGSIVQNSSTSQGIDAKPTKVLIVTTNLSQSNDALSIATITIGSQLRTVLSDAGVATSFLALHQVELDPKTKIEKTIREEKPSHILSFQVPSATIYRGTPSQYNLRADLIDVVSRKPLWKYSAEVHPGAKMQAREVATSVIERMRHDGVL
jgi:hypothetical protein